MRLSRRTVLAAAALLPLTVLADCGQLSTTSVAAPEFTTPLVIPPLAESTVTAGVRTFHLTAQTGSTRFSGVPGPTGTWGFDGPFLGPTLRAERGEEVEVLVENELSEATSVHWHGMHLPAAMDGGPHQMIEPGASCRAHWRIDQGAATLWYHPHPHGETGEHVYRGLAGLFLLEDDASRAAALPRDYGVDDLPLVVQDKSFNRDGALVLRHEGAEPGMLGEVVMVNGTIGAVCEVSTERSRLRLLNGSTARTFTFALPDRPLLMIVSDGGFLDRPVELDALRLAPGERAEVIAAFSPGETVRLRSLRTDLGDVAAAPVMGGRDEFDVREFRAAATLSPSPVPEWTPSEHSEADALHKADAVRTRSFELQDREINGERMDHSSIDEVVHVGDTEVWEVRSAQPIPHSFHIHDVQFRVLTVDGAAPPPELTGPKDTIYLLPRGGVASAGPLRGLRRPAHAVHVPLPHAAARGRGDDGPVRGHRAGDGGPSGSGGDAGARALRLRLRSFLGDGAVS